MLKLGGRGALLTAILLGGVTSFFAWRYVDQVSQTARPVETAPVVVAAGPIAARSVIGPEHVKVQQVPVEGRHPNALRSANDAIGKVVRTELTPGEPILSTKLFLQREESGLAFLVPAGRRAVSVAFTEVIGSGGLIQPGDRVDILGVFEVKAPPPGFGAPPEVVNANQQSTHVATMVLQNVEVLAVAQRLEGDDNRDLPKKAAQDSGLLGRGGSANPPRTQAQAQPLAKTATLAVTPDDALRLVLAEERGKIRLALRQAADAEVAEVKELPLRTIVQAR